MHASASSGGGETGAGASTPRPAGDPTPSVDFRPPKQHTTEELFPVLYGDLRRLAQKLMEREQRAHTFQATALVNEAYIRLQEGGKPSAWQSKGHFYAAAAETMRRILIDQARARNAKKRGGARKRVDIDKVDAADRVEDLDWLSLDQCMDTLLRENPGRYTVVLLRFYGGLSVEETAEVIGCSDRTVKREWAAAREWLFERLGGEGSPPSASGGE
jgi:RNA polymerase sigma factor (TIGR02999 family)